MIRKKFEDMEVGDCVDREGVLWVVKRRLKDDTLSRRKESAQLSELMLVNTNNPSQTLRPSPETEFDVMSDVDEN
ncbi:MAG: hypothetical protein KBD16_04130 [Candidatus Pacebacteria bacterium]|nr:hypothetical protein [Candidatus Paceibacterota bacterium]